MDNSVFKEYPLCELYKEFSDLIQEKVEKLEKEINLFIFMHNLTNENSLKNYFKLSKTAQNCLNFITTKEEESLSLIFDSQENIPHLLVNIIKIIYILIDRDYESVPNEKLMQNIQKKFFFEFNVDKLSKK
jgi:hypothetical protein